MKVLQTGCVHIDTMHQYAEPERKPISTSSKARQHGTTTKQYPNNSPPTEAGAASYVKIRKSAFDTGQPGNWIFGGFDLAPFLITQIPGWKESGAILQITDTENRKIYYFPEIEIIPYSPRSNKIIKIRRIKEAHYQAWVNNNWKDVSENSDCFLSAIWETLLSNSELENISLCLFNGIEPPTKKEAVQFLRERISKVILSKLETIQNFPVIPSINQNNTQETADSVLSGFLNSDIYQPERLPPGTTISDLITVKPLSISIPRIERSWMSCFLHALIIQSNLGYAGVTARAGMPKKYPDKQPEASSPDVSPEDVKNTASGGGNAVDATIPLVVTGTVVIANVPEVLEPLIDNSATVVGTAAKISRAVPGYIRTHPLAAIISTLVAGATFLGLGGYLIPRGNGNSQPDINDTDKDKELIILKEDFTDFNTESVKTAEIAEEIAGFIEDIITNKNLNITAIDNKEQLKENVIDLVEAGLFDENYEQKYADIAQLLSDSFPELEEREITENAEKIVKHIREKREFGIFQQTELEPNKLPPLISSELNEWVITYWDKKYSYTPTPGELEYTTADCLQGSNADIDDYNVQCSYNSKITNKEYLKISNAY